MGKMKVNTNNHNIASAQPKSRKVDDRFIPDEYKSVADGMEQQFAQIVFGEMNKTVEKTAEESTAEQYYNSLLLEQQSKATAQDPSGGLGIKRAILDQIYPERMRNEVTYNQYLKNKEDQQLIKNKLVKTRM